MRCSLLLRNRDLSAATLLQVVRSDPGMTADYYANRYFGGASQQMRVSHLLWTQLKQHGKVTMERDAVDEPPLWFPLFAAPRRHAARRHCADDEDLSILREAATAAGADERRTGADDAQWNSAAATLEVETAILTLVEALPGRDIQFYVGELAVRLQPLAPAAFRRLREAQLLQRETTPSGTYVWSCVGSS